MNCIGGYFELSLPKGVGFMHQNGLLLASCRNALELILISLLPIEILWIPYYTCEVILEPLLKLGIKYKFYHINQCFELDEPISLSQNSYILYTNYFGIKDSYVNVLSALYKNHLIVDNAQALYAKHIEGTNGMYSPRKYVGIPDGGIAYFSRDVIPQIKDRDYSYDRCSHLLKRIDVDPSFGYADFRSNAQKLSNLQPKLMSKLTSALLFSLDYLSIREKRRNNYNILHRSLKESNKLILPDINSFACPMVYPFYTDDLDLRQKMISEKLFVAQYWPNIFKWCSPSDLEYRMAAHILPLPIDQRYGDEDMDRIIKLIEKI